MYLNTMTKGNGDNAIKCVYERIHCRTLEKTVFPSLKMFKSSETEFEKMLKTNDNI